MHVILEIEVNLSSIDKATIAYCFNFSMLAEQQQQQPSSAFHSIWAIGFTEKFSKEGF